MITPTLKDDRAPQATYNKTNYRIMGLNPSTSLLMEQQPELFSTQTFSHSLGQRQEQLVMSRQQLIHLKPKLNNSQTN